MGITGFPTIEIKGRRRDSSPNTCVQSPVMPRLHAFRPLFLWEELNQPAGDQFYLAIFPKTRITP